MKHGDNVADLQVFPVFLTFLKVRKTNEQTNKQKRTLKSFSPPKNKKMISVYQQAVGLFTVPTSAS